MVKVTSAAANAYGAPIPTGQVREAVKVPLLLRRESWVNQAPNCATLMFSSMSLRRLVDVQGGIVICLAVVHLLAIHVI